MKGTKVEPGSDTSIPCIATILEEREHYKPMNMHFTARDALAHYIGLMESDYETDKYPQLLCLRVDYKTDGPPGGL